MGHYYVPAVHALHVAELVERWGITRAQLFKGFARSQAELARPEARLSASELEYLVTRARALTGEEAMGFHAGLQMRISAHGYLGFAAMTARTVRESLALTVRFAPTRSNAFALRMHEDAHEAALQIDVLADFGEAHDAVVFALVWGIACIGRALTGRELTGRAELAYARPAYFDRLASHLLGEVRFDQPHTRLVFAREVLDAPIQLADPSAMAMAKAECERQLDELSATSSWLDKARRAVRGADGEFRSVTEVAVALSLSERTLKRRLAEAGTSFSSLLDEAREHEARRLLRGDHSVDVIADRLGYSDAANFTRAFRRWTGTTPARARV